MNDLDFCCCCGDWVSANAGTMRAGSSGQAEIICKSCLALEQQSACAVKPGSRSGMLDSDTQGAE